MIRRLLRAPLLLAVPVVFVIGACSEKLENTAGCPVLCPGQQLNLVDTVFDPAFTLDTTLTGFPLPGFEIPLLLATRGTELDVRPIIRFDTLTRFYTPAGDTARPITDVDSATLTIHLVPNGLKVPNRFTIEAYDVADTTLVDSLPQTLLPFFQPGRLFGSVTLDSAAVRDSLTVRIPLDSAKVRAIVAGGTTVLRIGLRVTSTEPASFWVVPSDDAALGPRLRYRGTPDTTIAPASLVPFSRTPRSPQNVNGDYPDYVLVAAAPDLRAIGRSTVGGLPGSRAYFRFNLPSWLIDSTAVVSAKLELVQDPVRGLDDTVAVTVRARMVLAGPATADLFRASRLIDVAGFFIRDSVRTTPRDSGLKRLEINGALRQWRSTPGIASIPQAIVLIFDGEGARHSGARFFSLEGPMALRPRLRVTYVPNIRLGKP
ncbi:MAG: hypothetical protein ACKVS7_10785 [Gemmatimonadaceae bacterium]